MDKPWKLLPHGLTLAAALTFGLGALAQDDEEPADENVQGQEENLDERRDELTTMAEATIDDLSDRHEAAARLLDRAYGWAVLDTTKGGLIVTGAGGTGVAKAKDTGDEVFMHVGGAGIGAVGGLANYKLVLLFDDENTFEQFVDGEWQGAASAQAIAGDESKDSETEESVSGEPGEEGFVDGAAVYRVDESGLIAQAELEGMRFWPSDRLNEIP